MEKSVIAGLFSPQDSDDLIDSIKSKLESLLKSAGGNSIAFFSQKRRTPDGRYLLGIGKIEEIREFIQKNGVNLILIYNNISYVQQRNIENLTGVKVIDRTGLILDVFALRARTIKGKLQVELAQLLYLLPKLKGKGIELSRLGGGIGTRGPGEKKLETDRRKLKKRVSIIRKRLKKLNSSREQFRKNKNSSPIPVVSLAGYTSAGKSTLFNLLTGEETYVDSKLFSTLDPLLRKMSFSDLHSGYYCFLTDTVGFIRDMPPELIEAFRSTLEEISEADLILNIIDLSDKKYMEKRVETEKIFSELKISSHKIINVFNKIDIAENVSKNPIVSDKNTDQRDIYISASRQIGISLLKEMIFRELFTGYFRYKVTFSPDFLGFGNLSRWAIVLKKYRTGKEMTFEILTTEEKMLKFKAAHSEVFYEVLK